MNLLKEISSDLEWPERLARRLCTTAPNRYKVYEIPKRSGGTRTIAQPSPPIKELQRWSLSKLLLDLPISSAAVAYRPGINIAENARRHAESEALLKLDFKDFFNSIDSHLVQELITRHLADCLTNEEILLLGRLHLWRSNLTRKLCLSVGAPSSPHISNAVMFDFDHAMDRACTHLDLTYSRYADDLAVSGNEVRKLEKIRDTAPTVIQEVFGNRLRLNDRKTVLVTRKHNRHITGITITPDGKLSIGRDRKRRIHAMLHHFLKLRIAADEAAKLSGYLAFCKDVEPEFFERLVRKYGESAVSSALSSTQSN